MENKFKAVIDNLKLGGNKMKVLIAIGLAGILLIAVSEFTGQNTSKTAETSNVRGEYDEYVLSLEKKTQNLLKNMNGVGRCSVMITLENSSQSVYAKNTQENQSEGSYSKNDEYVLYEGQGGETPALIKQNFPEVKGVAVVCDGADNTFVRENIINSISSLYGIEVSKISVAKYKG